MARFLVWSDLHDEFWGGFDLPDLSAPVDGVLIAGDTHTRGRHLEIPARAARKYGCPVVVIWGNHEPYGSVWAKLLAEEERQLAHHRAEGLDIRVLHGAMTEIAGVRIVGATLWTDLRLYPEFDDLARLMVCHDDVSAEARQKPHNRSILGVTLMWIFRLPLHIPAPPDIAPPHMAGEGGDGSRHPRWQDMDPPSFAARTRPAGGMGLSGALRFAGPLIKPPDFVVCS